MTQERSDGTGIVGHVQYSVHGMWTFKKCKKNVFLNKSWSIYGIIMKISMICQMVIQMEHQHQKAINIHKGWDRYIYNILVQLSIDDFKMIQNKS